jgi:hypothetical protein
MRKNIVHAPFDNHTVEQRKMKTVFLYVVFLLGIPNFLGLLIGFPLAMLLAPLPRLIRLQASLTGPLMSVFMGLSMGVGCGVAGIIIVRLFGRMPGGAVPIISGALALFYYYSRGQSKTEAWAYVAGIYVALVSYWLWQPI